MAMPTPDLSKWLGQSINDASEETFVLFSQDLPSHDLGFVDGKVDTIDLEVAGRSLSFKQSTGLLNSQRDSGTTGAVLWNIAPLIGEWLCSSPQWLQESAILRAESTVVEVGCGITGLLGILLCRKVSNYFLTDQSYVMRSLRENVEQNSMPKYRGKRHSTPGSSNLHILPLDWEADSAERLLDGVPTADSVDLVIVCDCVYNEYLIKPLVQSVTELCAIGSPSASTTVLIAQQLRSDTVFEQFLEVLLRQFVVWRLPDEFLPTYLHAATGYVVHMAQRRHHGE